MDKPDGFVQIHTKQNVSHANWLFVGRGLRVFSGPHVVNFMLVLGVCVGTPSPDFIGDSRVLHYPTIPPVATSVTLRENRKPSRSELL